MNPNKIIDGLKKLLIVSACIVTGVAVSTAQNPATAEQSKQQAELLQRLSEVKQQLQQGQASQPPQGQAQQSRQPQPGQSPQPVTLRPVDTGQSVITFNLGGKHTRPYDSHFALKTNLLYAFGTLSPNLALEFGTGAHTSVEVAAGYNGWGNLWDYSGGGSDYTGGPDYDLNNNYKRRLDHIFGKAEFRYWLGDRLDGHFFGLGGFYTDYRVGDLKIPLLFEREYDYDGIAWGGALTWGYAWRFHRHWALEFSLSAGIVMFDYTKSLIEADSTGFNLIDPARFKKTYLGPTSAGIKLVFVIR